MKHLKAKSIFEWCLGVGILWFLIYKFNDRQILIGYIRRLLPSGEGSMLAAMLWGSMEGISREFYSQMVESGLVHILVVSGSNMMIVVKGLVEVLAAWLGRKKAIIVGVIAGWWYTNLVGWQIPVIRAAIMVTFLYLAQILGRRHDWWRVLWLTIIMMVAADPRVLSEVGFWLSFMSFAAVSFKSDEGVVKTTLRVTAWITPILAYKFGVISIISPLSNFLVLFLTGIITTLGMVASVLGIILEPVGGAVLWFVYPMLVYVKWVVTTLSTWEWGQIRISFNGWMLAGSYLMGIGWYLRRKGD
jgi:competence protein ComEC